MKEIASEARQSVREMFRKDLADRIKYKHGYWLHQGPLLPDVVRVVVKDWADVIRVQLYSYSIRVSTTHLEMCIKGKSLEELLEVTPTGPCCTDGVDAGLQMYYLSMCDEDARDLLDEIDGLLESDKLTELLEAITKIWSLMVMSGYPGPSLGLVDLKCVEDYRPYCKRLIKNPIA